MKTKEELNCLFRKIAELTNNFKKIDETTLSCVPQSLLIFRCILGISQKDFSKKIGISSNYLCNIENIKSKPKEGKIMGLNKKISNLLNGKEISFNKVYDNYRELMNYRKLTTNRAKEIRKLRKSTVYSFDDWKGISKAPDLARIIGAINGDGHVQINKDGGLVSFYSNNYYEIEYMHRKFLDLFGINSIIYKNYKGSKKHRIYFRGKKLALFLAKKGAIVGNKTNQPYLVPEWIIKGENKIKSLFLQGLYDTEGSIYFSDKRWRMVIEQYKNSSLKENGFIYMNQIRSLVENFGIKCSNVCTYKNTTARKDGSITFCFRFTFEKKYFRKFYKHVGFRNKKKQKRLLAALNMGA